MSILLSPQQPNLDPLKICGTDNPFAFKHKKTEGLQQGQEHIRLMPA
jgi:hypothetical protein